MRAGGAEVQLVAVIAVAAAGQRQRQHRHPGDRESQTTRNRREYAAPALPGRGGLPNIVAPRSGSSNASEWVMPLAGARDGDEGSRRCTRRVRPRERADRRGTRVRQRTVAEANPGPPALGPRRRGSRFPRRSRATTRQCGRVGPRSSTRSKPRVRLPILARPAITAGRPASTIAVVAVRRIAIGPRNRTIAGTGRSVPNRASVARPTRAGAGRDCAGRRESRTPPRRLGELGPHGDRGGHVVKLATARSSTADCCGQVRVGAAATTTVVARAPATMQAISLNGALLVV